MDASTLRVTDDWLLSHYRSLASLASSMSSRDTSRLSIDLSGLDRIDTAGASQLASLIGPERLLEAASAAGDLPREKSALIAAVCEAMKNQPGPDGRRPSLLWSFVTGTGQKVESIFRLLWILSLIHI